MNINHLSETQLNLINTAGPLFAEDGLKGTRIRAITEAAGVNVAGINYHFGSKENLFNAVVEYVLKTTNYINLATFWNNLPKEERTRDGVYRVLWDCLNDIFTKLFKNNLPLWYFKMVNKFLVSPNPAFDKFDIGIFEEDLTAAREILSIFKNEIKEWDVDAWLAIWYSQSVSFSVMMPKKIVAYGENNNLISEYVDKVLENTFISIITLLEADSNTINEILKKTTDK